MISILNSLGAREQTAVDSVHNRGGIDHPATKVSAVETFDGILTALDFVKLEVDIASGVGVYCNVNNLAILLLALVANVVLELSGPVVATLPATC